jgi:FRG domain.
VEERYINSEQNFHSAVLSLRDDFPIFRGVSNSQYELITTFGRAKLAMKQYVDKGVVSFQIEDGNSEFEALREFKRKSLPYLNYTPLNDWEWLALAQHHGLPTRLLDWSFNPLVAVFLHAQTKTPQENLQFT